MQPEELTAEEVRNELQILIDKYPDRLGKEFDGEGKDPNPAYFKDEMGEPLTQTRSEHRLCNEELEDIQLVEPICLVGQWVESFHPTLKGHKILEMIFKTNQPLYQTNVTPFNQEVNALLKNVQRGQDRPGMFWGALNFEENYLAD